MDLNPPANSNSLPGRMETTGKKGSEVPASEIRIPLTIGICGHRELATPENEIREELGRIWSFLHLKFPHTPFVVLDSLAEGADRIVLKYLPSDIPYVAVLPFEAARFKEDFAAARSKAEFDELLSGAARVVVAGERAGDYSAASRYVLEHSDLLLALWDKDFDLQIYANGGAPLSGGTWDSVTLALATGTTGFPDERRLVEIVHLPVRRRNSVPASSQESTQFRILKPGVDCIPEVIVPELWSPAEELIKCDRLNQEYGAAQQSGPGQSEKKRSRMNDFTGGADVKEIRTDVARFSFFSSIASKVKSQQRREFTIIFGGAVAVGAAILICRIFEVGGLSKIPLRPYAVFLACTWLYFKWYLVKSARSDLHILSRSITEGLRIKIFWALWGLPDSVADSFPEGTRYLIRIFRNWELLSPTPQCGMEPQVLKCWVERQRNWFERKIDDARRKDRWCRIFQWGVLTATMILAGICLLLHWHPLFYLSKDWPWDKIAGLVVGTGLLLYPCAGFFRQKKAWLRLAEFYCTPYRNFDYVARICGRLPPKERSEAIRKLGIRTLWENSKWQGLSRDLRR